ncbi:uncharacterized protein GIQ15_02162 [Arthroderma uncinatum]|uniref:uncharacterized protein n=1 Tax=Arthroderma uncinatum TaxID=74035 RepID=UPI00144ABBC2|nr:uncharacterized protein GIQ15_02162 [Arthroderma uncinatum]KAF3482838.1 hypothetical protein GIQ15_02162 [Arthroderma uncinatum]
MGGVSSTTRSQDAMDFPNGNGNGDTISSCGVSYDYLMEVNKSTKRYNAFGLHGYDVYGYPSRGPNGRPSKYSVIVKPNADIVDTAFLGWNKFAPPKHRFTDQSVEDRFCSLLSKSGGRLWPSNVHHFESTVDPTTADPGDGLQWFFAWPGIEEHPSARNLTSGEEEFVEEGGVWALEYKYDSDHGEHGKLRMCITMAEKVEVMKELVPGKVGLSTYIPVAWYDESKGSVAVPAAAPSGKLQTLVHRWTHDHLRCQAYNCLPPLKRRCFSRPATALSHPSPFHRNHESVAHPAEFAAHIGHKAKEKEEDKEFFLDLLSSATTKREAKSYLSRFTAPPKPLPADIHSNEENTAGSQAVNAKDKPAVASVKSSTKSVAFDLPNSKATVQESLHVALVKIKNPHMLDDACLHGISKTLSQLSRLAMSCCIVVDVDTPGNNADYRRLASDQASRFAAGIDKVHSLGARRLDSVMSLDGPARTPSVLSRKSLLSPLYRGQIVVVDPVGYTSDTSEAFPISADELILALTRELAGLTCKPTLDESAKEAARKVKERQQEVSLERLIVLDPLGGIPSLGHGRHKSHVFVNLEQEYEDIRSEITQATRSNPRRVQESDAPGLQNGLEGHLANLTLLQKTLAILPPSSSGLITTPHDATNLANSRRGSSGTPMVGTRQRRNPLIHNLLTDKPVLSASLPARRRGEENGDQTPNNTQLRHSTFVKRGMPLTMLPDPRIKCWTAANSGAPRINLTDTAIDLPRLVHLIDDSFNRKLDVKHYLDRVNNRLAGLIIAGEYEGGAILTWETPPGVPDDGSPESIVRMVPYLDKFAVLKRSQGTGGVADIVFNAMVRTCFPRGVCWRSRKDNPVNKWYFERSRGTWKLPDSNWTMFWTTDNVPENEQLFEDYEGVCRSIQPSWADGKKEID